MKLNDKEKLILAAMKERAGGSLFIDDLMPIMNTTRQDVVVCIRRLTAKLATVEIIVERVSKLGRGYKGEYAIPLTITNV